MNLVCCVGSDDGRRRYDRVTHINVGLERSVRKALWKGRALPWTQIHGTRY